MVSLSRVRSAQERIAPFLNCTALQRSRTLGALCGNEIYLKPENLQKVGAFKFRGAINALLQLGDEARRRGVVTGSSGNHGQAVACAARLLGIPVVVVVPENVSSAKAEAMSGYGAEVLRFGTTSIHRIGRAEELARERHLTFIHPFDDPEIIAGQGTIGLEILRDLEDVDVVLVPCGGGGLAAGVVTAICGLRPQVQVYGVESEKSDSTWRSLQAGRRTEASGYDSIADGIRTAMPGETTFEIMRNRLEGVLRVSEKSIKEAVVFLLERCKMLVEPSGAVPVAALLAEELPFHGKKVVAVLSGGNVDLRQVAMWIEEVRT